MKSLTAQLPPPPGRNEPCPCGSGRKFKHCCALKPAGDLSFQEGFAQAELKRGIGLEQRGRIAEALVAYEVAAADLPEARSRLAQALEGLGRREEAISHFRAAAGAVPTAAARRMDLAMALLLEENTEEAEVKLRAVLDAYPSMGEAHALLGRILAESGRFDAAAECFERALVLQPGKAGSYYHLVRARKLTEADRPLIRRMLSILPTVSFAEHLIKLHLALAKAFDDLGDYGSAMRHIVKANTVRKKLTSFDRDALARLVDTLIERFTPEFFARHAAGADLSRRPVLIVGMPRSGTTLTEQMLSSHADVAGAGELTFWTLREAVFEEGLEEGWVSECQSTAARQYLELLDAIAPAAGRVIDKNPFNFIWLGLIRTAFPNALVVHCRRHPIDTCLSICSTHITARGAFPADLDDLVFYYRQYQRLMDHWRVTIPPSNFIEVDYETVVADPETVARGLVSALGLAWDPACLQPERNLRVVKTSSAWQVRQPIYGGSVERWRRYEPWLGPLSALTTF